VLDCEDQLAFCSQLFLNGNQKSTYTKAAGGTGGAVGLVVVVVSRHDCFVLVLRI
jgi:hypothetical protein